MNYEIKYELEFQIIYETEVGLPPPPYGPKTEQIYRREINEKYNFK